MPIAIPPEDWAQLPPEEQERIKAEARPAPPELEPYVPPAPRAPPEDKIAPYEPRPSPEEYRILQKLVQQEEQRLIESGVSPEEARERAEASILKPAKPTEWAPPPVPIPAIFQEMINRGLIPEGSEYVGLTKDGKIIYFTPEQVALKQALASVAEYIGADNTVDIYQAIKGGVDVKTLTLATGLSEDDVSKMFIGRSQFQLKLETFEASLNRLPQELQDAYKKGGFEAYNVVLKAWDEKFKAENEQLFDGTWINKAKLQEIKDDFPTAYNIITTHGIDVYNEAYEAALSSIEPYKKGDGYRLRVAVGEGVPADVLRLVFSAEDVDKALQVRYLAEEQVVEEARTKLPPALLPILGIAGGIAIAEPTPIGEVVVLLAIAALAGIYREDISNIISATYEEFETKFGKQPTSDDVIMRNPEGGVSSLTQILANPISASDYGKYEFVGIYPTIMVGTVNPSELGKFEVMSVPPTVISQWTPSPIIGEPKETLQLPIVIGEPKETLQLPSIVGEPREPLRLPSLIGEPRETFQLPAIRGEPREPFQLSQLLMMIQEVQIAEKELIGTLIRPKILTEAEASKYLPATVGKTETALVALDEAVQDAYVSGEVGEDTLRTYQSARDRYIEKKQGLDSAINTASAQLTPDIIDKAFQDINKQLAILEESTQAELQRWQSQWEEYAIKTGRKTAPSYNKMSPEYREFMRELTKEGQKIAAEAAGKARAYEKETRFLIDSRKAFTRAYEAYQAGEATSLSNYTVLALWASTQVASEAMTKALSQGATATEAATQAQQAAQQALQTMIQVSTQTALQTATQTIAQTATQSAIAEQAMETEQVIEAEAVDTAIAEAATTTTKPWILGDGVRKKEEKLKKILPGTIAWRQGIFWITMPPPYDKRYYSKSAPPGAYRFATGEDSAYKTVQAIGGMPSKDVKDIDIGIAIVDIIRKEKELKIHFKRDVDDVYKGKTTIDKIKTPRALGIKNRIPAYAKDENGRIYLVEEPKKTPRRRKLPIESVPREKIAKVPALIPVKDRYYLGHRLRPSELRINL